MFNIKACKTNLFFGILFAFIFCAGFVLCAYAEDASKAQENLDLGKQLYESGKFNQAMDQFVNVFVEGNSEQIAEANEYMNLIHYAAGNVEEGIVTEEDTFVPEESINPEAKQADVLNAQTSQQDYGIGALASPYVLDPQTGKVITGIVKEQIVVQDGFPSNDPEELRAIKKNEIDRRIYDEISFIVSKLSKVQGVSVYTRGGFLDAIDMDAKLIFGKTATTFTPESKEILDMIYNLMILNGRPSFVLLPPGSYSDNVTIQGVRQAAALNSYFINKGISTAKLSFNMGLSAEEPPLKFSDLNGLSIVFDYTSVPKLKNTVADRNTAPILSVGMYPEDGFFPRKGEGMVVDFSVVQAVSPVKDWTFQIVRHAGDNKYYVVRQISGTKAAYRQIYWNGRKEYFGPMLPSGRYTFILIANDEKGRQKVVRRPVSLFSESTDGLNYYGAPKGRKEGALDYQAARLWNKPARQMITPYTDEENQAYESYDAATTVSADELAASQQEGAGEQAQSVADMPEMPQGSSSEGVSTDTADSMTEVPPAVAGEVPSDAAAEDVAADPNANAEQYEDIPEKQ